jgi:hypothetical protein
VKQIREGASLLLNKRYIGLTAVHGCLKLSQMYERTNVYRRPMKAHE